MPLFLVNCWPSPSNDGTCEVSIEYELENENVTLYDVVISIPLPCVSGHIYTIYHSDALDTGTVHTPPSHHIQVNGLLILIHTRWLGQSQLSLQATTASLAR